MANEVNRIAELLLDAWKKADPKSSVALHPTSYVATFADMAKAIIEDWNTRPAAPVEGLESYEYGFPSMTKVERGGDWCDRSQAEAIIAEESQRATNQESLKRVYERGLKRWKARAEKAEADNAALTARVKELEEKQVMLVWACEQTIAREEGLETQLAAARKALEWYANPEIYRSHPHGIGFEDRDKSYVARAALEVKT